MAYGDNGLRLARQIYSEPIDLQLEQGLRERYQAKLSASTTRGRTATPWRSWSSRVARRCALPQGPISDAGAGNARLNADHCILPAWSRRRKLRSFLTTLGLYVGGALLIGYFGVNAYTGNHGLRAKQDLDQQFAELTDELDRLKHERADWQRRVALLQVREHRSRHARRARARGAQLSGSARADADAQAALNGVLGRPKQTFALPNCLSSQALVRQQAAALPAPARFRQRGICAMGCMAVDRRRLARGEPWPSPRTRRSPAARSRADMAAGNGAAQSPELTKEQELAAYRDMLLIRRFEEKAGQMYGMGLIGGFCHLYIGQEAVVVGMQMALEAGRPGHHRLSRPRPHAGLRHGPQGRDGRADRPRAAAIPRARAARCTCSPPRRASTAATASSARRCRSAPASPSPTSTAATTTSR